MSRELIKHTLILKYSSTWMDTIRNGSFGLTNTNRLVRFYSGANGLKTGSTSKALFCISATAKRDNMQLIAVIMAAPTRDIRNAEAKKLLDFGFANFGIFTIKENTLLPIQVKGGISDICELKSPEINIVIEKEKFSSIITKNELPESINAPVCIGDKIGRIVLEHNEKEIFSSEIISTEEIPAISFLGVLFKTIKSFCIS